MTAKEYLLQIKRKDTIIKALIRQKDDMWAQMYSLTSSKYDGISVQSSKDPDKFGALWAKIDAKERRISEAIDQLADDKLRITREIDALEDERYVEILLRRYIQMQSLKVIAKEMDYDYVWARTLHGHALQAFTKKHPEIQSII